MNSASTLVLPPLSAIYSAATRARLTAYRRGWLPVSKLSVPVISVGNLTTGGTGKTPLVEWVCRAVAGTSAADGTREFSSPAIRVCVLTRGYGRANPSSQVVVSNATEILADEQASGDEPYLLAKNLVGVASVICNPDRFAAGKWAIENLGSEVFVLDDGFQHLRLARDLDIVTIDATNPWGGGRLLPYGRLREPLGGLTRADCIVVTRSQQSDDATSIKEAVERLAGGIPVFTSRMATSAIRALDGRMVGRENVPQPVAAFCGVGNPDSFFDHVRREGYAPAFTRSFPDHHHYKQSELDQLVSDAQARGAKSLITTAKDAIKLSRSKLNLPCFVLEIQISI
ncbi:MAG TPA: tetraacyldisaccharide 4'-kinase, partial [Pyrinomonadaceae bacterium]|nr:tetraacyldisaccharide 4'-kinase [Pyrinomonadaceae bacterium]